MLPTRSAAVLCALTFLAFGLPPVAQAQAFSPPTIEGIAPASGPAGAEVSVTGESFGTIDTVTFGGLPVAFSQPSSNEVRFNAPMAADASYEIVVENVWGPGAFCCFELATPDPEPSPTTEASTAESSPSPSSPPEPVEPVDCQAPGENVQCSDFGRIGMAAEHMIQGEPAEIVVSMTLHTSYHDRDAEWLLFSIQNVTADGSPITISLLGFRSAQGPIAITKTEQPKASELSLWAAVADVPVDAPISLEVRVGSTDRGAYRLEVLVMPFDVGYGPIQDATGQEASLYSFTALGVNKATPGEALRGSAPGFGGISAAFAIATAAVVGLGAMRRRQR